jgi:predicted aldo/keto reductase-like oxidoreductase
MGFSFHDAKEEFIRIVDGYNWEFAQVQFNILDEHAQAGIDGIKYAHAKGLGIIVMEPLRGGALAGKVPKEAQKIYDGTPVKRSPADWALRWVWDRPEITVVLSGMNNDDNIKENLRIAQDALPNSLSEGEISVIDNFRKIYLNSMHHHPRRDAPYHRPQTQSRGGRLVLRRLVRGRSRRGAYQGS